MSAVSVVHELRKAHLLILLPVQLMMKPPRRPCSLRRPL
jgi:hypothetical protein